MVKYIDVEVEDFRIIDEFGKIKTIPNCKKCGAGAFKIDGIWTCIVCKKPLMESNIS